MKNKCQHITKKNLSSNNDPYSNSNIIEVKCIECGYHRFEIRYKNDRIDSSKWFKPKN